MAGSMCLDRGMTTTRTFLCDECDAELRTSLPGDQGMCPECGNYVEAPDWDDTAHGGPDYPRQDGGLSGWERQRQDFMADGR